MEAIKQLKEDIRNYVHKTKRHERKQGARPNIYSFIVTLENKYTIKFKKRTRAN